LENIDLVWAALAFILLLVYLARKRKKKKCNMIIATTSTFSLATGFIAVALVGLVTALLIKH